MNWKDLERKGREAANLQARKSEGSDLSYDHIGEGASYGRLESRALVHDLENDQ